MAFDLSAIGSQFFVGLSRSMILFIVTAGLSFVLGVLRVPNVAHGSLYMIGAFSAFSITKLVPGATGFWLALVAAPLVVAAVSFISERALFCHLYQREHLMLLLFTFALSLILGDLVKITWGAELIFGIGAAWAVVLAVFLFDLFFAQNGWCGNVGPVGAFYSVLALKSPLRVVAARRAQCNDCMDCYAVFPELRVIKPALKGEARGLGPAITSPNCTNCGRCIDVCSKEVFRFGLRGAKVEGRERPAAMKPAACAERA